MRRCEEYSRQKQESEHGGHGSYGEEDQYWNRESPTHRLRECVTGCETQYGQKRERCQRSCQQEYEREKERHEENERQEREEEKRSSNMRIEEINPYVFEDHHFITGP